MGSSAFLGFLVVLCSSTALAAAYSDCSYETQEAVATCTRVMNVTGQANKRCLFSVGSDCAQTALEAAKQVAGFSASALLLQQQCSVGHPLPQCLTSLLHVAQIGNASVGNMGYVKKWCGAEGGALVCEVRLSAVYADLSRALFILENGVSDSCTG